jgi:hypothetical protein
MIFNIWLIGCIVVFLVMVIDYIILNLQLGISLQSILNYVFTLDNFVFFIGLSLGSWLMLIIWVFNNRFLK